MEIELNLENLKIGDEIVIITPKGNKLEYGWIHTVRGVDPVSKRWRFGVGSAGTIPPDGKGYNAMHSREIPHFYYSANPIHIQKAKEFHEKARIKREKEETEKARRMSLALPIGDLLKTEYYDSEECYQLDSTVDIAEILVSKLTDEQIMTLKGWLGV